ncbi:MAG TPA: DUF4162 domain-containing protein, partial [Gemmatimonadaceae bacterium]
GKVIALGTPRELIGSLGAEHVVEFTLADGSPQIHEASLRELPGVRAVRRVGTGYEIPVDALHRTVPALLALIASKGAELAHLTTHSASLEDVFVSLTGRQLRDE